MSFIYDEAKYQRLRAGINILTDDVRVILVMSNSTADVDRTAQTVAGIAVLDELDSPSYSSGGVSLTGKQVLRDAPGHRGYWTANHPAFPNLAPGSRQVKAALVIAWRGSLGASIPIGYADPTQFPFTPNGTTVTIQWNALGIEQLA